MPAMKDSGRLIFGRMLVWPELLPESEMAWQSEERGREGKEEGHFSLT